MSSAFEYKENEIKELRNQLKLFEQRFESQKQTNISTEEVLKSKENKIKDLKGVINRLEQSLNDDKISTSKKIDTFLKEIGEKSQTIKNLTNKLKETDKLQQDYKKNENEIINLKSQLLQTKQMLENIQLTNLNDQNKFVEEIKQKSEEVLYLKNELQILQCTLKENEKKCLELQSCVDEINLKNTSLLESEKELKEKHVDYKKSVEELQNTIKNVQNEKDMNSKMMKLKLDENQLKLDELNKLYQEMVSQFNQEKLNKISGERSIESVIKDYNLLTEENAYLKKERQNIVLAFQDMIKKIKVDFENFKSFTKDQLSELSLIFMRYIKQLKADYSSHIKFYHNNLVETKEKLGFIQKAYSTLKSDCIKNLEYFKVEIIEKYNQDIILRVFLNNEELEKREMDFLKLQEEINRKLNFLPRLLNLKQC